MNLDFELVSKTETKHYILKIIQYCVPISSRKGIFDIKSYWDLDAILRC